MRIVKLHNAEKYVINNLKEDYPDFVFTNHMTVEQFMDMTKTYVVVTYTGGARGEFMDHSNGDLNIYTYCPNDFNYTKGFELSQDILDKITELVGPGKPISTYGSVSDSTKISNNNNRSEMLATMRVSVEADAN